MYTLKEAVMLLITLKQLHFQLDIKGTITVVFKPKCHKLMFSSVEIENKEHQQILSNPHWRVF